ncbi:MAG TPA: hypothetical protein VL049_04665 [Candidatus Dormibacteraeota bacterium]|nr:hypothetical protein [Candidatus Dormibacteraeota bacterium]
MNDMFESTLFEPTVILPSQISAAAPWASDTSGPIALMLAVLEEAARCIERGRQRRHRALAVEAQAWVRSDSRGWPFAFASICDVLGLDVDAARARFLADQSCPTGERRAPVWKIARGRGRTSVLPPRAARAA